MNVMFKEIRHGNIEKIQERIAKKPSVVNEVFMWKRPLKDIGQSPLQVALKCARFDIIDILLDNGADPNFIEDCTQVPPNSMCCPVLADAIKYSMDTLLYTGSRHHEQSAQYVRIIEKMLTLGADPNKKRNDSRNPVNNWVPLGVLAASANYTLKQTKQRIDRDPESYGIAKNNVIAILNLLIKYGADVDDWLDNGEFGGETNRKAYLDPPESTEDKDYNCEIRAVLQKYFNK